MTLQAQLRQTLFADLARALPEWDLFDADHALERVLGGVVWRLRLSTSDDARGFAVAARIEVEHLRHGVSVCTIGADLGELTGGRVAWHVGNNDDANAVAAAIQATVASSGQAFLDRYSSVPEILRALRNDPEAARLLSPGPREPAQIEAEAAGIEARWQGECGNPAPTIEGEPGTNDA